MAELINPWIGSDAEKATAWESLSDRDKEWIGNGDPTDPFILARAPDSGASQRSNNSTALAQIPSYSSILDSVLDGSIFKNIDSNLSSIGSTGIDTTEISNIVDESRNNAMVDAAIAKAALAQKNRIAASEDRELSPAEIEESLAPLSTLTNLNSALANSTSVLTSVASSSGSAFGIAPTVDTTTSLTNPWTGVDEEKANAWALLTEPDQRWLGEADPTDEIILARAPSKGAQRTPDFSNVGSAIASFSESIPEDPEEYAAFASIPENAAKIGAANNFTSQTASAGASLLATLSASQAESAAKKTETVNLLKAEAMLSMLTKPQPAALASTLKGTIDTSKFDALTVIKAQESIPAPLPTVVEPQVEQYRPLPVATSPRQFDEPPAAPPAAPKSERVTMIDVQNLNKKRNEAARLLNDYLSGTPSFAAEQKVSTEFIKRVALEEFDKYLGPTLAAENARAKQIEKEKPNASSRTPEENALVEKRQTLFRPNFFRSSWWKGYQERNELYNTYVTYHTEAYNAWQKDQAFSTLSTETQQAISESINRVINFQFSTYTDFSPTSTEA